MKCISWARWSLKQHNDKLLMNFIWLYIKKNISLVSLYIWTSLHRWWVSWSSSEDYEDQSSISFFLCHCQSKKSVVSAFRRPFFVSQVSPGLPGTLFHCSKDRTCDRSLCTFTFILDGGGAKGKMGGAYWPSRGRSHRGHVAPGRETVIGENIGTNVCVWFTKAPTYQIRFLKTLKVFWPWIFFIRKENYIHDFRNLCLPFWC